MSTSWVPLLRSVAIGAATGSRSTVGPAAIAFTSSDTDRGVVASRLGSRAGTVIAALLSAGELVGDKLPTTPTRLEIAGLAPRLILGVTSAAAVARRDGADPRIAGGIGLAAALGAAVLGTRARAAAAQRFGSDRPGAVIEDVTAATLGWLGARRP